MKHKALLTMAGFLLVGIAIGVAVGWKFSLAHHSEAHISSEHDDQQEETGHDEHEDVVQLSEEQIKEFGIELGAAGPGELQIRINLPGEIVANADNLVHIVSRVNGVVREVKKRLGDPVHKGEVMAIIESRELADAKAAYLGGLERIALAEANFTREEKLWKSEISSEQEYLIAKQALAEARIALRSAEQKLHALGFTHEYLKKLPSLPDEEFIRYEIVAPFGGTITKKHITLGEVVSNESEIYEIADLSSIWVNLTVYQKDLASVDTGQQVVVRAAQVGTEATGVIDYVSPIVEESTRTATARVVLPNPDGRWRPGIFITGEINIREVKVGILVPRSALQTLNGQDVVFIQTQEGFKPQPIEIGLADSEHVEIVSGLKAGQRFAMTNSFTLKAELGKEAFGGHHH